MTTLYTIRHSTRPIEDFKTAVEKLNKLGKDKTTAIMCAETVPWRCHRRLVGDALIVRGVKVLDISDLNNFREHTMTSFAKVEGKNIIFPKPHSIEEEE